MSRTIKKGDKFFLYNDLLFTSIGQRSLSRIPSDIGYIRLIGKNARKNALKWTLSEETCKNIAGRKARWMLLDRNVLKLHRNRYYK